MCEAPEQGKFEDSIFGTQSVNELVDVLSNMKKGLSTLPLTALKSISKSLGIAGKSSNMTKDRIIERINIAIRSHKNIDMFDIPKLTYMVLDTETTLGFGTGRLIQLAYQIYRRDTLVYENDLYVYPCFESNTKGSKSNIDLGTEVHGITYDELYEKGIPISKVIDIFIHDVSRFKVDVIVAHNLPFDWDVLKREALQLNISDDMNFNINSFCTCRTSSILTYVQIRKNKARATFPSLQDLYNLLFDTDAITKHRALDDVKMASDCFFKLIKLGIISESDFVPLKY